MTSPKVSIDYPPEEIECPYCDGTGRNEQANAECGFCDNGTHTVGE